MILLSSKIKDFANQRPSIIIGSREIFHKYMLPANEAAPYSWNTPAFKNLIRNYI